MTEIKDIQVRKKIIPEISRTLGQTIKTYLDEEIGANNYQWLFGDDDAALTDEEGNKIKLRFPCAILIEPEIKNNRLVQDYRKVVRDLDRDALEAKLYNPSKPVKLEYELRIFTNNPDNDESFMLALERASEEIFCLYPKVTESPPITQKVNIWWGEGKKYSYDVENTSRVYKITVSVEIDSRKYRKVALINPQNPIEYTPHLSSTFDNPVRKTLQFLTKKGELFVYINEEYSGLPTKGTIVFDDWSKEEVVFITRRLNMFTLQVPLKNLHIQGTSLQIGEIDASS